jgi:hypothetical protein
LVTLGALVALVPDGGFTVVVAFGVAAAGAGAAVCGAAAAAVGAAGAGSVAAEDWAAGLTLAAVVPARVAAAPQPPAPRARTARRLIPIPVRTDIVWPDRSLNITHAPLPAAQRLGGNAGHLLDR